MAGTVSSVTWAYILYTGGGSYPCFWGNGGSGLTVLPFPTHTTSSPIERECPIQPQAVWRGNSPKTMSSKCDQSKYPK